MYFPNESYSFFSQKQYPINFARFLIVSNHEDDLVADLREFIINDQMFLFNELFSGIFSLAYTWPGHVLFGLIPL